MTSVKKGSFNQVRALESAREYGRERFEKSTRMRRLDRCEQAFARRVFERAGGSEASIADVPCGNGRFYPILSAAKQLYLFDYASTMLEALLERHPDATKWKPEEADITGLPLEDASVDLAFCMRLFHHLDTWELRRSVLAELARISRRYVALSLYDKATWRYVRKRLRNKIPSGYAVSLKTFRQEAAGAGLRLILKYPRFSFIEQQRCLLFEKMDPSQETP